MARISSSTLFNFTDSIDHLVNNLKYGFYCHNTYEKLPLKNNGYRVPMACFCDIPLSLISEHFDWYGRYGIGIKRTYARQNGVKPVWYVTSESNLVKIDVLDSGFSCDQPKFSPPVTQNALPVIEVKAWVKLPCVTCFLFGGLEVPVATRVPVEDTSPQCGYPVSC